ncbi:MAG: TRAP transporter small permease [Betaproteobacteria bacterium]|nr:TRAP transporter small permease [Betaproteobacteria bacterium]
MYARLMRSCGTLAALVIAAAVVLVCYDVVARNFGLLSLTWIVEVTEYALPLATFLAAPWLLWRQEHVRLDLLQQICAPATLRRIERLAALLGVAVCAVVSWYGIAALLDARQIGSLVMKTLVFPEWWLFVPLIVSFGLLGVESARRAFLPLAERGID